MSCSSNGCPGRNAPVLDGERVNAVRPLAWRRGGLLAALGAGWLACDLSHAPRPSSSSGASWGAWARARAGDTRPGHWLVAGPVKDLEALTVTAEPFGLLILRLVIL